MTDPTRATDPELVRRHLAGETAAFDEIVSRHRTRVYAVALRVCGRHEDALDVAQEVFVTAYRSLGSFRGEAKLTTWLHRLAVNAAVDLGRRRSRRDHAALDDVPETADAGPGPEELALAAHRAQAVRRGVASLSPDHRAVVVLHDLEDLDYSEVAFALKIPIGTVKSRLHRARLELARILGHLEPEGEEEPSKVARPDE